ncbi:sulfite exporter TauE/SafE family protein [Maledivibacter halophilus]|uniref:Probable membrane transporter protein n=1 Tax=Maledivibacter halophilus TaxID=36842 RepID=A0A1T5M8U0_9FIRM|nr:sulfite exporter TauE/SafE family protein [Maledivibacter halophilus]SKC84238.1 hypothetical protein SAMN02194393_04043 [Maledivibacter halophilus]
MESEIVVLALGFIVIFSAGLVQGATSFGFSLLSVPLLGAFMPLKIIVPMLIIYSFIINSIILYKIREHLELKRISLLIIAAVVTTPIGANMLINLDESILKIMVGIIVTISAVSFYFGYKVKIKNEKLAYIPVGLVSGLLNGSISISGPPVILFLTNQSVEKQVFRATLTGFFWVLNIMTIIIFLSKKLINVQVLKFTGYLLPALIGGVFIGINFGNKVKEETFEKLTTILIIIMGILSIVSGIK